MIFGDSAYHVTNCRIEFGPDWAGSCRLFCDQLRLAFVVLSKAGLQNLPLLWLARYRRRSKDYERNLEASEAKVYFSDRPHGTSPPMRTERLKTGSEADSVDCTGMSIERAELFAR